MDRYAIARNLKPKAPEPERVRSFSFDTEPESISKFSRREIFALPMGQSSRVGIVFDNPKAVFTVSDVHFHARHYFHCKSVEGRKAICCQQMKPVKRFACVLVEYDPIIFAGSMNPGDDALSIKRVVPWVFGTRVYDQMKAFNAQYGNGLAILYMDFTLRRSAEPFRPWDLIEPRDTSMWQTADFKDTVLAHARPFLRNMKRYIGEDLTPAQIKTLFETEPITPGGDNPRYGRAQPRLRDRLEENDSRLRLNQVNIIADFLDEADRADDITRRTGATPISGAVGRTAPYPAARTDADQQINLDDLFRTLDI